MGELNLLSLPMLLYTLIIVGFTIISFIGFIGFIIAYMTTEMKRAWLQLPLYLIWPVTIVVVLVWTTVWAKIKYLIIEKCWKHEMEITSTEGYWVQKTCKHCGKTTSEWMEQYYKEKYKEHYK